MPSVNELIRPVHPRVCGERFAHAQGIAVAGGSSPRVRGTRQRKWPDLQQRRFIPACAGNAVSPPSPPSPPPVHPRVCGERATRQTNSPPHRGSSPRVRGTRVFLGRTVGGVRFIPACAGNADTESKRPDATPVHPRVCGERWHEGGAQSYFAGSSPRVRGTRGLQIGDQRANTVHPRVCGERASPAIVQQQHRGSSPRVRGTLAVREEAIVDRRFIPACAGNAQRWRTSTLTSTVHPRVCGERSRT